MSELLELVRDNFTPLLILLAGAAATPVVSGALKRLDDSLRGEIDLYLGTLMLLFGACAIGPWASWLIGDRLANFAWQQLSISGSLFMLTLWLLLLNPATKRKSRKEHRQE